MMLRTLWFRHDARSTQRTVRLYPLGSTQHKTTATPPRCNERERQSDDWMDNTESQMVVEITVVVEMATVVEIPTLISEPKEW